VKRERDDSIQKMGEKEEQKAGDPSKGMQSFRPGRVTKLCGITDSNQPENRYVGGACLVSWGSVPATRTRFWTRGKGTTMEKGWEVESFLGMERMRRRSGSEREEARLFDD